ncbi:MAG: DUF483 domain-containing protein [Candidatus Methanomethylicaceae archaeon]
MTSKISGYLSLQRIVDIITDLSKIPPESAKKKYSNFPSLAEHISRLFAEDRLFDIPQRLELQLEIVKSYAPPVRPALDPYTSTQIGLFNKNFSDWEIGGLLNYPVCCIKSFAEDIRYDIDALHLQELKNLSKGTALVTTAGFIPHSIFCRESSERALISLVKIDALPLLKKLEAELARKLPHFHPEYQEHYYGIYYI